MGQYLTFSIGDETCAVDIQNVETVLEEAGIRAISGAPAYVVGLISVRGEAIPVIDVRAKLGLEPREAEAGGCIIVFAPPGSHRKPVGALVDSVSEVVEILDEEVSPIGDFAVPFDPTVIRGIGKRGADFVTLIAAGSLLDAPSPCDGVFAGAARTG